MAASTSFLSERFPMSGPVRILPALAMPLILWGASLPAPAAAPSVTALGANPPVRVLLFETSSTVFSLRPSGSWSLCDTSGRALVPLPADSVTTLTLDRDEILLLSGNGSITAVPAAPHFAGAQPLRLKSDTAGSTIAVGVPPGSPRPYQGSLELHPAAGGGLEVIAELPLEEYLRGVVPSEIGASAPAEAQAAQAVAARSFAVLALLRSNHPGTKYDVCSTVDCQVYSGLQRAVPATDAAVRATRGQVLTFEGKPIPAFYAAHCGGHTEDIRNSWPARSSMRAYHGAARFDGPDTIPLDLSREEDFRKWLRTNPDAYCNPDSHKVPDWAGRNFRWRREFSADDVTTFVVQRKEIGRVLEIRTGRRGASGRVTELEFVGETGTFRIGPELPIRRLFVPALRSAAFTVDAVGPAGRPTGFVFHGAGSGHGVGMCQTGAMGMANAGRNFREILNHYYPNATVEKLYD